MDDNELRKALATIFPSSSSNPFSLPPQPKPIPYPTLFPALPIISKSISLKDLLKNAGKRIDEILELDLQLSESRIVPKKENVGFSEGKILDSAVLFIDMRGSTSLSQDKYPKTISKIYKAFFDCLGKVISWKIGAHIRGFAGDRLMAVFTPGDESCNIAVDTAIIMQTIITHILNPKIKKRWGAIINYGIGIDFGEMMAVRVGIYGGGSNSDLVWSGNAANYASKLADFEGVNGIRITDSVYSKLTDHKLSESGANLWPNHHYLDLGSKKINYYKDNGLYKVAAEGITI